MANVKRGQLTPPPQWWKHLKRYKRWFWKSERQAAKDEAARQQRMDTHA